MTNKRYHALDAARGLLMLLGVYFHIIVFHYAESPLGLFAMSMHYFRMHAFFLISGFFSALVLNRKGHYEMLNNRFKRIFLPLIIMAYPVLLLNKFSIKFNELRYENTFTESLRKSFIEFISKPWENFIPWDTGHLWFLSLLFGMSIFSFLFRNSFSFFNGTENPENSNTDPAGFILRPRKMQSRPHYSSRVYLKKFCTFKVINVIHTYPV